MLKYICDRCGAVMEKTDGAMRLAVYKSLTYKADNEEQPKRLDLCPECAETIRFWINIWSSQNDVLPPSPDAPKDDERMTRNGPMTSLAWAAFFAVTANWVLTYFREHGIFPVTGLQEAGARQARKKDEVPCLPVDERRVQRPLRSRQGAQEAHRKARRARGGGVTMQYFIGAVILTNLTGFAALLLASPFLVHSTSK